MDINELFEVADNCDGNVRVGIGDIGACCDIIVIRIGMRMPEISFPAVASQTFSLYIVHGWSHDFTWKLVCMGGIEDIILKWMTNSTIKIQYLNSFSQFRFSRWLGRTEAPQYLIVLTIDMCLNKKNKSSSTLTPYQRSLVFSYIRIYQEIWLIQFKF